MDLKTFLENFEAIAEAPGGIPKLRSLILDLAVRGKLVPQHPEDKTAMPPKALQAEKFPYSLPVNWVGVKLGDVVDFVGGSQPAKKQFIYEEKPGYVRLIQIRDFKTDGFKTYVPEEYARRPFKEDDIMVGRYGPPVFQILRGLSGTYNVALMKAIPTINSLSKDYLYYLLQEPRIQNIVIADSSRTAGQSGVRKELLNEIIVLVPPLAEQKRIVEKVDELMALCDRYEAAKQTRDKLRQKLTGSAIASLMNAETDEELEAAWAIIHDNWRDFSQKPEDIDSVRQAILQFAIQGKLVPQKPDEEPAQLLSKAIQIQKEQLIREKKLKKSKLLPPLNREQEVFEIPSSWQWIKLDNACLNITDGFHNTPKSQEAGIPYLTAQHVKPNSLDFKNCLYVSEKDHQELVSKTRPSKGDVLVVNIGAGCGTPAIIDVDFEFSFKNVAIFNKSVGIDSSFLYYFFLGQRMSIFQELTQGGAQPFLSLQKLRNIPFPLPPFFEQKRIVAKVDELMKLCDQVEASLRQSQQRAESLAASAISHLTI